MCTALPPKNQTDNDVAAVNKQVKKIFWDIEVLPFANEQFKFETY